MRPDHRQQLPRRFRVVMGGNAVEDRHLAIPRSLQSKRLPFQHLVVSRSSNSRFITENHAIAIKMGGMRRHKCSVSAMRADETFPDQADPKPAGW